MCVWQDLTPAFLEKKAIKSQNYFHNPQDNSERSTSWDYQFTILRNDDGMVLYMLQHSYTSYGTPDQQFGHGQPASWPGRPP